MKLLVKRPREKGDAEEVMLFDLGTDIGEQHNLAESRSETVEKLRTRMEELDNEITMNARAPWQKE
jgi:predicted hydrocarbon binding protein